MVKSHHRHKVKGSHSRFAFFISDPSTQNKAGVNFRANCLARVLYALSNGKNQYKKRYFSHRLNLLNVAFNKRLRSLMAGSNLSYFMNSSCERCGAVSNKKNLKSNNLPASSRSNLKRMCKDPVSNNSTDVMSDVATALQVFNGHRGQDFKEACSRNSENVQNLNDHKVNYGVRIDIQGGGPPYPEGLYPRTCEKCLSVYTRKSSYFHHLKTRRCERVTKRFEVPEKTDGVVKPSILVCPNCSTAYTTKKLLNRHLRTNCQNHTVQFITCIQPDCTIKFRTQLSMMQHLAETHSIDLGIQKKTFLCKEDFEEWKKFEERRTFTSLTRRRGNYYQAGKLSQYYSCMFNIQERSKKPVKYRQAHSRSNLVNTCCPARIDTLEGPTEIEVTYYSYHNHELDPANLKYCKWYSETKDYISRMIEHEVPVNKIQEELSTNNLETDTPVPIKEHFITARQISRMKYDLAAKMKIHKRDLVSVQLLVDDLLKDKPDSILVYKPQGKQVEIGQVPPKQLSGLNLFVLGIQEERQTIELINSYRKVLCIDVLRIPKMYNFTVITFLIQDEFSDGYPVAHFITNRTDSITLTSLFTIFKASNSSLDLNAFMTSDNHILYDSFSEVFDRKPIHFLCKSDMKASWLNQLNEKVENRKLIDEMHAALIAILEESEFENFQELLSSFLSKYQESCQTFCKHFSSHYVKIQESWALCFRNLPYAAADSSEFSSIFHRKVRTAYRLKKATRRLDDFINVLLRVDKYFNATLAYKRATNEVPNVEGDDSLSRHSQGLQLPDEHISVTLSKSKYKVKSETEDDTIYTVTVLLDKCSVPGECYIQCHKPPCYPLCCHMYTCSCKDLSALCQHVHKVHAYVKAKNDSGKSEKPHESDESDNDLSFSNVLKKALPPPEPCEEERLLAVSKKAVSDLEVCLNNQKPPLLSKKVYETLNFLLSECNRVLADPALAETMVKEAENKAENRPKEMPRSPSPVPSITNICPAPNPDHTYINLTKQDKVQPPESSPLLKMKSSPGRVTKPRKNRKVVRIPLKALGNSNVPNFSGRLKLSDSLTKPLYKLGPYEIKLYHLKSLDRNILKDDLERIQIEVPGFRKGLLYDCIIYSYLKKISLPHPSSKVIDPCVCQILTSKNRDCFLMKPVSQSKVIFFPCNPDDAHWVLIVVYPELKVVKFLDPLSNIVEERYHHLVGLWVNVLSQNSGVPISEWQIQTPSHTLQSDSTNCGVYVCWYADQLLKNQPINIEFNEDVYRQRIYETLKAGGQVGNS